MVLNNDTRGWIMTCVSGIACVVGSSIICIDLLIRYIPGKRSFRIQDSNVFLSSSLSLSFGVMLFSSLYSMLPGAQRYLDEGGYSPDVAAYANIGCFLGGVVAIQFVSRLLHHYIPSHVVDCDHTHEDESDEHNHEQGHDHYHDANNSIPNGRMSESTPLLANDSSDIKNGLTGRSNSFTPLKGQDLDSSYGPIQRPTLQTRLTSRIGTFVSGAKSSCDEGGPCYGYSELCSHECFQSAGRNSSRVPMRIGGRLTVSGQPPQPSLLRTATMPHTRAMLTRPAVREEEHAQVSSVPALLKRPDAPRSSTSAIGVFRGQEGNRDDMASSDYDPEDVPNDYNLNGSAISGDDTAAEAAHHHHVPSNAFLAIGLQTSIAIALHKLPEGFITYATNHANPKLGFTVFMALFIHNITEGFAMALPLYLAVNSRWKAMFWSSLLGGVSQPLGAGVAALWFKIAGKGEAAPGDIVYGCMFAATAGIMASVALQLYSESLTLTHNRNLCNAFAFLGMGILGISFALTAG